MNNMTNSATIATDIRLIHNVLSTTMCILGFVLNFIIIIAIIRYRLYKQTDIKFIVNLSVLHCLSTGVSLAHISYNSFTIFSMETPDLTVCKFFGFVTYTVVGCELTALCLISFNRYILIVYMEKYAGIYGNRKNMAIMFLASWILYIILFLLPTIEIWGKMIYDKNRFLCQPFLHGDSFSRFIAYFAVGSTAPPLIFCYIGIIWKVNATRLKLNKVRDINQQNNKRPAKMPLMIIFILTTFGILYFPYIFVQGTDPNAMKYNIRIHIVTVYIAWLHLLFNPIIYAIFNKQIQTALKKLFGFSQKNETFTNIQSQHTLNLHINVIANP